MVQHGSSRRLIPRRASVKGLLVRLLAAVAAFFVTCTAPAERSFAALAAGDHDLALTHGARTRTYRVHVPPESAGGPARPVVLCFHGGGGTAAGQEAWSGLDRVADREGFVAVYPDGT